MDGGAHFAWRRGARTVRLNPKVDRHESDRPAMTDPGSLSQSAFDALSAGRPEAVELFRRALDAEPGQAALIIGEAEALASSGGADPTARLQEAVERNPQWVEGQSRLASLLWESGDADCTRYLRDALRDHPGNAKLWKAYFDLLGGTGDYLAAAEAAREANTLFASPVVLAIEAFYRGFLRDDAAVEALLDDIPPSKDRDEVEVRHRIRLGQLELAADILDRLIGSAPQNLSYWAFAELLWRKIGDERWQWLIGSSPFIVKVKLGYTPEQLEHLASTLASLHRSRHQPIGESVRGGTQTRGALLNRQEKEIVALRGALQAAVDAYRDQLPAFDPAHPLLRHRNRPLRITEGWSVRLSSAGFHIPHLHPDGVLSSAFYVRVPTLDKASQEGWLELGRPPENLGLDLEPLATLEPEPASLVLFPSYLYHGTRPFSAGERMSVAFDVV